MTGRIKHDWHHKIAAIACLVAVFGVVWFSIAAPIVHQHQSNKLHLADRRDLLQRWQARLLNLQRLTNVAPATQLPGYQRFYVNADSDALVTAQVQARLRSTLAKYGAQLQSMQNLTPRQASHHAYLGVRLQWTGTLPAMRQVLHDIQSQIPYLFVQQLTLQAPHLAVPAQLPPNGVALLTASMEVVAAGWMPTKERPKKRGAQ